MQILFPLFAVTIWAFNAIAIKMSAGVIDPAAISFYRWVLALLTLTPFILRGVIKNWGNIKPYLPKLAVLGLLGMVLNQTLAYYAAQTVPALEIGIINSSMPLLTVVISIFLLRVAPTWGVAIGGTLSFGGIVWLISAGHPTDILQMGIGKGELMLIGAAFSYALYGVLMRKWEMTLPNWQSLYMQICFGVLFLTPNFLMTDDVAITYDNAYLIIFSSLFASIAAPYLWIQGLLRLGPNKATVFMNLMPLMTAVIAVLFLKEDLETYHLIGGGITLLGIIITQKIVKPIGKVKTIIKKIE